MTTFVDRVDLHAIAGDGGHGCASVHREKFKPLGGPDGGNGGRGGNVVLVVDPSVTTLINFHHRPHQRATSGKPGQGSNRDGADGDDVILPVPDGTVVLDERGEILADLTGNATTYVVARGGRGGLGNAALASPRRKAPGFALKGEPGEHRDVVLELKSVADVALVGYPSAGKSSLIAALSQARPKIADYPFTTLEPNLGVVRFDDGAEFVVADIPGLIEGAAEGRGLGHRFLRHVERARVLCVLVDLAPVDDTSPDDQVRILLDELGEYDPELLTRPRVVVGTKTDMADPDLVAAWDGPVISSITRQGVRELVGRLASLVHEARDSEPEAEGRVILRPESDAAWVEKVDDNEWRVHGRKVLRAVHLNDVTTPDALSYIDERLAKLGVPKLLSRAGATEGDVVWIGSFSFDYHRDI